MTTPPRGSGSLRRRLVALQVGLVAVGLAAFAFISYNLYSASAYQQIDNQLQSAAPLLGQGLVGGHGPQPEGAPVGAPPPGAGHNLPAGSYAAIAGAHGIVTDYQVPCYNSASCPVPRLPRTIAAPSSENGRFFTVPSTDGSTSFRVLVRSAAAQPGIDPDLAGDLLVTAIPLTAMLHSLHRLILLYVSVGGAVLVLLSVTALLLVRRGLHPLERMAATARAIAGGDLSQRASPADGHGEVGQLGQAFNAMMGEIQQAFADRDATEARLRQFLADASHELRTPLTSIRGHAELYRMGAASPDNVFGRIEEDAEQMGGLVEELLLLARLDQTRPPRRAPVDLVVLVADACEDAAVMTRGRRLSFEAPGPVRVRGDADHLRRAVTNLLTNAARHTPEGTPVEVFVGVDGDAAVVRVRDHGPGLSPEGLGHAFDRFWRADQSRTGGGTGLGLAIVAAVASEHAGRAGVRNAPDGGAEFEIRLPLSPGPEEPASSAGLGAGSDIVVQSGEVSAPSSAAPRKL